MWWIAKKSDEKVSSNQDRPIVFVTLLECSDEKWEQAIDRHATRSVYRPIYLTTSSDIGKLLKSDLVFEFMPPLNMIEAHQDAGPWVKFVEAKYHLLLGKWKPDWVVNHGLLPETYFQKVREMVS